MFLKPTAELVRFFDAARYADFSQRFELEKIGSGFDELGQAFSEILNSNSSKCDRRTRARAKTL